MISAKEVFQQLTTGPGIMDSVCNFIIRPPRSDYDLDDLGPEVFRIGDEGRQRFMRHDFELENMRGLRFKCSWFKPYPSQRVPCVVYCHANCGGRYDALEALFVLKEGMSLFCFDFCGSGMSEGEYISLGFYERQDLAAVMEFLTLKSDEVDGVALWGRSMGAVTAIMYASKDPWIRCIVCDSPFATLRVLINDLVERHGGRTARVVPNAVVQAIVERIRKRIMKRASFDMDDLDTVKYARLCRVPALLFHGSEDDFVSSKHCEMIRDAFPIPCLQQYTPGNHNDERDEDIQKVIAAFLHLYLIDKPTGERELRAQQEAAAKLTTTPTAAAAAAAGASSTPAAAASTPAPSQPPAAAASPAAPAVATTASAAAAGAAPAAAATRPISSPSEKEKIAASAMPPPATVALPAASTSTSSSTSSTTSSELHRRFYGQQDPTLPPAVPNTTDKTTIHVPAAQVATLGIGETSLVDGCKEKVAATGGDRDGASKATTDLVASPSAANSEAPAVPSVPQPPEAAAPQQQQQQQQAQWQQAAAPMRPTPVFSAVENKPRLVQTRSPVLSSTNDSPARGSESRR